MDYLTLKYIHIISSTILFGTGIGSAFFFYVANRRKIIGEQYFVARYVVIADGLFIAPSVAIQLMTGLALIYFGGYQITDKWVMLGLSLYFFTGVCWLPVVVLQIKMRNIAKEILENGAELPQRYWQYNTWWIILGALAFPTIISVFYFMVFKPV